MYSRLITFGRYFNFQHHFWEHPLMPPATKWESLWVLLSELLKCKTCRSNVTGWAYHKVDNIPSTNQRVAQQRKHEDCTAPVLHRRSLVQKMESSPILHRFSRQHTLHIATHTTAYNTQSTYAGIYFFFFSFFFSISFHSTIMSTHFDYVGWFVSLNTDIWQVRWTARVCFMLSKQQSRHFEVSQ